MSAAHRRSSASFTRNTMAPMRWVALLVPLAMGVDDPWLPRYDLAPAAAVAVALPGDLIEISGLAMDARGHLFAHQDETSVVYDIDPVARRVVKRFHVGRVGLRGDFEGIAIAGDRIFLSTSDGDLLEFRSADNGQVAPARTISTGLGRQCELEGLAFDKRTASLLLPCKTPRVSRLRNRLTVFSVPLATLRPDTQPRLSLPLSALERADLDKGFHPSSVEVHPASGSYFLLAAQEEAVLEIGTDGAVLASKSLSRRRHPQPEGITFGPDLALWIADEGPNGGGLHRYPLAPPKAGP
jgi:uncharacterized protein YjiK